MRVGDVTFENDRCRRGSWTFVLRGELLRSPWQSRYRVSCLAIEGGEVRYRSLAYRAEASADAACLGLLYPFRQKHERCFYVMDEAPAFAGHKPGDPCSYCGKPLEAPYVCWLGDEERAAMGLHVGCSVDLAVCLQAAEKANA